MGYSLTHNYLFYIRHNFVMDILNRNKMPKSSYQKTLIIIQHFKTNNKMEITPTEIAEFIIKNIGGSEITTTRYITLMLGLNMIKELENGNYALLC